MLPIIKDRVKELKAWLDESENKRREIKKAAIASGDPDSYIDAHEVEITPWREEDEEKDACYRMLTAPILYSDDMDIVLGHLKNKLDFLKTWGRPRENEPKWVARENAAQVKELSRIIPLLEVFKEQVILDGILKFPDEKLIKYREIIDAEISRRAKNV